MLSPVKYLASDILQFLQFFDFLSSSWATGALTEITCRQVQHDTVGLNTEAGHALHEHLKFFYVLQSDANYQFLEALVLRYSHLKRYSDLLQKLFTIASVMLKDRGWKCSQARYQY